MITGLILTVRGTATLFHIILSWVKLSLEEFYLMFPRKVDELSNGDVVKPEMDIIIMLKIRD